MGAYLDRLHDQFDEIRDGVEAIANRAADDNRDVSDDEQAQIDRDRSRMDELTTAIQHYTALEEQTGNVAALRRSAPTAPATRTTAVAVADEYDVAREFPTPADYAITLHRAWALRDPEAIERVDRATAHQKTTDNPGLIPRTILGPVLNLIDATRPFVNSCQRRTLPAGKFDRPHVTQHVAVEKQTAEKELTASLAMKVELLAVTAATYAGHLNISRQDVKWTSPGILQLVFDDFAAIYAQQTDADAATQFIAAVGDGGQTAPAGDGSAAQFMAAVFGAVSSTIGTGVGFPDTLYLAPDAWATVGGMTLQSGAAAFPGMSVSGTGGSPMGLSLVVDHNFPDGTAIIGPSRFNEWYEDVDGLMQVQEPDVLGQLVGYAGYAAYLNAAPTAFTSLTGLAPGTRTGAGGGSRSGKSGSA